MLETRLPYSPPSTVPRPAPRRGHPDAVPGRSRARTVPRPAVPRRAARHALILSRLARSEARMLTLAVALTALMCAVLVVYLAAYAHVTWLGLEQSTARRQLAQEVRAGHRLQVEQAELQDRGRIVTQALKLHMTLYTGPVTYVKAFPGDAPPNAEGGDGGTTADVGESTDGH